MELGPSGMVGVPAQSPASLDWSRESATARNQGRPSVGSFAMGFSKRRNPATKDLVQVCTSVTLSWLFVKTLWITVKGINISVKLKDPFEVFAFPISKWNAESRKLGMEFVYQAGPILRKSLIFGVLAYQLGNTHSRTITEVKQRLAWLVFGWETY